MFNHSEEDLPVKLGGLIDQLIFEQIVTPDVKEVTSMDGTMQGNRRFANMGLGKAPQYEDKYPYQGYLYFSVLEVKLK